MYLVTSRPLASHMWCWQSCFTFNRTPGGEMKRTAGLWTVWSPAEAARKKARPRWSGNIRISSSTSPSASRVCLQRPDWEHKPGHREELHARIYQLFNPVSKSTLWQKFRIDLNIIADLNWIFSCSALHSWPRLWRSFCLGLLDIQWFEFPLYSAYVCKKIHF